MAVAEYSHLGRMMMLSVLRTYTGGSGGDTGTWATAAAAGSIDFTSFFPAFIQRYPRYLMMTFIPLLSPPRRDPPRATTVVVAAAAPVVTLVRSVRESDGAKQGGGDGPNARSAWSTTRSSGCSCHSTRNPACTGPSRRACSRPPIRTMRPLNLCGVFSHR
ncbi:hypothetical protein BC828DRAFT_391938 [Blastocladiella britannica]|nr:hypothetical protein BC828DRAFT_391938 [Blastocladiella britannica]